MTLIQLIDADKPKPLKHGGTEEAEGTPGIHGQPGQVW